MIRILLAICLFAGSLTAADQPRNRTPGSSSVRQGATLPSTCRPSPDADVFYKSSTGLYVCTATNTWSLTVPGATLDAVTGASALVTPGDIPQVSAVPGALEVSRLNCALGVCKLEAAAANPSTLIVKATAAQGATDLVQVKNAAGAVTGNWLSTGGLNTTIGYAIGGFNVYQALGASPYLVGTTNFSADLLYINTAKLCWSFDGTPYHAADLCLSRLSANHLKVTDGSTGVSKISAAPGGTVPAYAQYTVSYTDSMFKVASTTATKTLFALPANWAVNGVFFETTTAFADASSGITAATCTIGDGTTADLFVPSFNIMAAVSDTNFYSDGGQIVSTKAGVNVVLTCTADNNWGHSATVISAATNASPVELTSNGHGLWSGTSMTISGATGSWTPINGTFTITQTGANTFTIPVDSSGFGALAGSPVFSAPKITAGAVSVDVKWAVRH